MNKVLADAIDTLNSLLASLCIILSIIMGLITATNNILHGILVIIIGILSTIMFFGFMAVLLDIRAELKDKKLFKFTDPNRIDRPYSK